MIKIAIIDSDEASARAAEEHIQKYAKEAGEQVYIWHSADGGFLIENYKPVFDIIFLEPRLKHLGGMGIAKYIRKFDSCIHIVLTGECDEYALEGYTVNAADYLLKPVSFEVFSRVLKRLFTKIKATHSDGLFLPNGEGITRINFSEVTFIESFRHKMHIHTVDRTFTLITTMQTLEDKLGNRNFFRCNRSFLINLNYVREIKGNNVIVYDQNLAISRAKRALLLEQIGYFGRGNIVQKIIE